LHYRVKTGTVKIPKNIAVVNRVDFILNYCRNKTVLHIGFADYPFTEQRIEDKSLLHLQLKEVAKTTYGSDNNLKAVEKYILLTGDKQIAQGDLMNMPVVENTNTDFDIILLGEVLEHLKNPHQAAQNLYNSFPAGTFFLVTVPNYTSLDSFAGSLNNKESIHPDHYWYFSPYTLLRMFPPEQFSMEEIMFGMYFQKGKRINFVLRHFSFTGDCIIAVFKKK
jgi:hypothetical protein